MIISCDMTDNKETEVKEEKESVQASLSGRQVYELGFHVLSTLNEDELEAAVESLRKAVSAHDGTFISEATPELLDLAYTMTVNEGGKHTKYDTAYFGWIKFEMEPEQAVLLKAEVLETDKNILRYILIRTVREETRAQMREETLQTLEEVKTTGTIQNKKVKDEDKAGEEVSDSEIDKAVEELVGDEPEKEVKEDTKEEVVKKEE